MGFLFGKLKEGLDLDPKLVNLFRAFFLFFLGNGICGIFVNLFLLRTSNNNIAMILQNNLFLYLTMGLSFFVMGWFAKRLSSRISMQAGVLSYILALILLLVLQKEAPKFAILLGSLQGFGVAAYCVGSNVLFLDYTTPANRTYVFTQMQIVMATATFAMPLVASIIISCFANLMGYFIVFAIALTALVIVIFMLIKLKDIKSSTPYMIFSLMAEMKQNASWRNTMLGESFRGIRDGFIFFNVILIFMISQKEMYVGFTSFMTYAATVLFGFLLGGKMKEKNRMYYLKTAVFVGIFTSAALTIHPIVITIILYVLLNTYATIVTNAISGTIIYNNIDKLEGCQELRIESIVLRDMVLNAGRMVGVILAFFLPQQVTSYVWLILFISMTQIIMYLFFKKANEKTGGLKIGNENHYGCSVGR